MTMTKFADDTKIGRTIRTEEDARAMQEDLNKLSAWSEKWQMNFNVTECSILNVGKVKMGAYAGTARGRGAHLRNIGP